MGLFHKKGRTEGNYEKTGRELLVEVCETVDNASSQLELIKKEYEEVNRYLQDAQIIAELQEEDARELKNSATHILELRKDIDSLNQKKTEMTEFQFSLMERYEEVIPAEIKRMKREEEYKKTIQSDLRKLAGEKGVLLHEEGEEREKKRFLVRSGILAGFAITILLLMYVVFYLIFETFLEVPFLATVFGGLVLATYFFWEADRNRKAIQMNMAKLKRLTEITNKVKIKYVNQTASLDYSHDKFAIDNVMELEERYKKYMEFKEDEKKRKKTSETYEAYRAKLKEILEKFSVHDTEVWTFQAGAILDKKEMVEIRHRLNERRARLREMLEFNTRIVEENIGKLKELAEKHPESRRVIYEMMESYQMKG